MNIQPKLSDDIRTACWRLLRALEDYKPIKRRRLLHVQIELDEARDTIRKAFNIEIGPLEAARRVAYEKALGKALAKHWRNQERKRKGVVV